MGGGPPASGLSHPWLTGPLNPDEFLAAVLTMDDHVPSDVVLNVQVLD